MEEFQTGIQLQDLDATIQDAVRVTRELGYSYLWIDALCIAQDDAETKAYEISRMGPIYQNAALTIVAARASSVREGFLSPRAPAGADAPDHVFQVVYESLNGLKPAILVPEESREDTMPSQPWDSRGWTLQEQVCSGRQLRFGSKQTRYICVCSRHIYEEFDGWLRADMEYNRSHYKFDPGSLSGMIRNDDPIASASEARREWHEMVQAYSNRNFTRKQDRLPAISSIAQQMAIILADTYLCRLWKSTASRELLWERKSPESPFKGPKLYPTWSWASVDGPFELPEEPWRGPFEADHSFEILDHVPEYASADQYGEVTASCLRMRGLMTLAPFELHEGVHENTWTVEPKDCVDTNLPDRFVPSPRNLPQLFLDKGRVKLDTVPNDRLADPQLVLAKKDIFLLLIAYDVFSGYEGRGPKGLVLLRESENIFSRAGTFGIRPFFRSEFDKYGLTGNAADMVEAIHVYWGGLETKREIVLI